jgi:hypothetical protein
MSTSFEVDFNLLGGNSPGTLYFIFLNKTFLNKTKERKLKIETNNV